MSQLVTFQAPNGMYVRRDGEILKADWTDPVSDEVQFQCDGDKIVTEPGSTISADSKLWYRDPTDLNSQTFIRAVGTGSNSLFRLQKAVGSTTILCKGNNRYLKVSSNNLLQATVKDPADAAIFKVAPAVVSLTAKAMLPINAAPRALHAPTAAAPAPIKVV